MLVVQSLALGLLTVGASAKICTNLTIPVQISARNGIFGVSPITCNQDATTFTQNYNSIANGTNYTQEVLQGYQTIQGTYSISAKYCTPDQPKGNPTIQVLTHGIGFDKSYWDLPYNNFEYSYIDVAVDTFGFSTLSIDRLGIGNSSHGDPYSVVQAPAEVSALYQIVTMLRNGNLPGVSHAFTKIVNVGHSFGSQQSYELSTMYPNATDAIVLTGFSFNGSFFPSIFASWNSKIAALNQPLIFGNANVASAQGIFSQALTSAMSQAVAIGLSQSDIVEEIQTTEIWDLIAGYDMSPPPIPQNLPPGYLTWSSVWANQYAFLYPANIDPNILFYAEQHKQPYTVGEVLTLGGAPAVSPFAGPVMIFTGNQDAIYCGGDCSNTGMPGVPSIPAEAQMYFPGAKAFEAYIQPNTAHAINLHMNSTAGNAVIQNFLIGNGLGSA